MQMFGTPQAPPVQPAPLPPSQADPAIANRANEEIRARQANGRASQILTNPEMNQHAGVNQARKAMGA